MTPIETNGEKIVVHWRTRDDKAIRLIRERFGLPSYTTLNGLTPAILRDEDREVFQETAQRGYFSYKSVNWIFNGQSYSW